MLGENIWNPKRRKLDHLGIKNWHEKKSSQQASTIKNLRGDLNDRQGTRRQRKEGERREGKKTKKKDITWAIKFNWDQERGCELSVLNIFSRVNFIQGCSERFFPSAEKNHLNCDAGRLWKRTNGSFFFARCRTNTLTRNPVRDFRSAQLVWRLKKRILRETVEVIKRQIDFGSFRSQKRSCPVTSEFDFARIELCRAKNAHDLGRTPPATKGDPGARFYHTNSVSISSPSSEQS